MRICGNIHVPPISRNAPPAEILSGLEGSPKENRPIIFAPSSLRSLAVHLDHAHVKVSHANSPDCSCVLGSLRFPSLEYLEVLGDNSSWNLSLRGHFKDLPKLKILRLQRCSVSPSDDTFFRSLKLLDRLELVDNLKDVKWCKNYRKEVSFTIPPPVVYLTQRQVSRRES